MLIYFRHSMNPKVTERIIHAENYTTRKTKVVETLLDKM